VPSRNKPLKKSKSKKKANKPKILKTEAYNSFS
jgi:hypothetical protein